MLHFSSLPNAHSINSHSSSMIHECNINTLNQDHKSNNSSKKYGVTTADWEKYFHGAYLQVYK